MDNLVTFILGGGKGTRLMPLTSERSKPAVPLGGKYRLIDIPISNCINSELRRIYLLTQFNSVSLHRHIRQTYNFDPFNGGFVEILAAQQTNEGADWYQGTADAVRKQIRYLQQPGIEYVLILSGDQLYRMDYRQMLKTHVESGAHATIAALPVDEEKAADFGIMRVNDSGRVEGFLEKPKTRKDLDLVRVDPAWLDARGIDSKGRTCLASMGIYLFNIEFLLDVLNKTTFEDFGKEIFPTSIRARHVQTHLFDGYWEDIGTIKAFYDANLALASKNPPFSIDAPGQPIYSRPRFLPPTRIDGATIRGSLVADGCEILDNSLIENSLVGLRCVIGQNAVIKDSILMGADYFNTDQRAKTAQKDAPPLGIGEGTIIEGAIVDKNCRIGKGITIRVPPNTPDMAEFGPLIYRDGVMCVPRGTVLPDGWSMT
ncbi:MAG: glucose-1-phosphate adenylyltransferase [Planctomycetaceae bacterium]|nr:glucose-1-phosphate adenylyltransferase [Planctomycetaceae bacterium]